MQCAKLAVPVDWSKPEGKTITLTVARTSATGEAAGTVLFSPGGPGGAGVRELSRALSHFAGLRTRMNVVTWNPRGGVSGEHIPLASCAAGPVFATPDNRREYDQALKANAAGIAPCRDAVPELFAHMDSATQARDMDAIRAALGEEKISYFGNSYGGVLGASYARLFPQRLRAMVVDSVPNHVSPLAESERLQYKGLEAGFKRFVRWCADSSDCAPHGTDVEKTWQDVVRRAERHPLPGAASAGERRYDGDDLKFLAYGMIDSTADWPTLAKAIASASKGDASGFDPQGRGMARRVTAMLAVNCADGFRYDGYRAYRAAVRRSVEVSPNFSGMRENAWIACSPWAAKAPNPPAPLPARALPPLLGVGRRGPRAARPRLRLGAVPPRVGADPQRRGDPRRGSQRPAGARRTSRPVRGRALPVRRNGETKQRNDGTTERNGETERRVGFALVASRCPSASRALTGSWDADKLPGTARRALRDWDGGSTEAQGRGSALMVSMWSSPQSPSGMSAVLSEWPNSVSEYSTFGGTW